MHNDKYKILITGGAGFIGSNLVDRFLHLGHTVVCLDNLSTGFEENIAHHLQNEDFRFINGDIRDFDTCKEAVHTCDYVLHQAALGSVPRSIHDPQTTNEVNITGFLNMLVAARDANVKRFVYAASSSTYGDSKQIPKSEENIGKPLSPYAVTKYVNELYADVFSKTYNMQCIGLRYFNVFGKRQSPEGAYAAVIPLWVKSLIDLQSPIINGDGSFSRDFTYIDNVLHANENALFTPFEKQHFHEVCNIAFGGNTTLNELFFLLRENLSLFNKDIALIEPQYGDVRKGDIPHSQASIEKAKNILSYNPKYNTAEGIKLATQWYFENFKGS